MQGTFREQPYQVDPSPRTPPMNTSPTNSPACGLKAKKPSSSKETLKRPEAEQLLLNRSHTSSPGTKSAGSASSEGGQQELPQIRNISNMSPYLIGRNFESFSGIMHTSLDEERNSDL